MILTDEDLLAAVVKLNVHNSIDHQLAGAALEELIRRRQEDKAKEKKVEVLATAEVQLAKAKAEPKVATVKTEVPVKIENKVTKNEKVTVKLAEVDNKE